MIVVAHSGRYPNQHILLRCIIFSGPMTAVGSRVLFLATDQRGRHPNLPDPPAGQGGESLRVMTGHSEHFQPGGHIR